MNCPTQNSCMVLRLLLISLLFFSTTVFGQLLKGTIRDKQGEPIPFARVYLVNTSNGTFSNANGYFQLSIKKGTHVIEISTAGYQTLVDTVEINEEVVLLNQILEIETFELEEVVITKKSQRNRAREIMRLAIDRRPEFNDARKQFKCTTYCFSSLEKEITDSIITDSVIGRKKMNLCEWTSESYFKADNRYKDVYTGFIDLTDRPKNNMQISISVENGNEGMQPQNAEESNPYLFVNRFQDADLNLFENLIRMPDISLNPLISPLAFNAFVYYNYDLKRSFFNEDNHKVYEISLVPRFEGEALFNGTLFIQDSTWELLSYELGVNKTALAFFKDLRIVGQHERIDGKLLPTKKEFIFLVKEGKERIHGAIRLRHNNYQATFDDSDRKFWLETSVYNDNAYERDSSYWASVRPFPLKSNEMKFIREQDSIVKYHASESYLTEQDSVYNNINIWSFLFNGVGHRNTFKKVEFQIDPLIQQVVPFGVGGYRHRLGGSYSKEFESGRAINLHPQLDYGFYNKDMKGSLEVGFLYDPMHFSKFTVEAGDVYDFLNSYQGMQGLFSPANRVRNQKLSINHRRETFNGLYLKVGFSFSDRTSIDNISYPSWVENFGTFSKAVVFEGYRIFMGELELEYHFRQKYMIKNKRKLIVGSPWPVLALNYKVGIPKLFGGQSNFDYLEVRLSDDVHLNTLGDLSLRLIGGTFMRKNDLRVVEHKYFRTSDKIFFSNPLFSTQLLDTALNTANSYVQFNFIHHFNGFFLNKIWLINRLKLQETVGGSFLAIPDSKFAQVEFYAGIERPVRIRKQVFKIGFYAVTKSSTFEGASINYKIGINFYNSFYRKWDY